jgi:ribosomal-protein-alanine N-acetyltransferase
MATAPEHRPMEVDIIPMRRRHLRQVLAIEEQVYPRPWSASLFLSELALRSSRSYVVAKVGTAVRGYAGLMMTMDDGHITTIAVDPAWQGHRIGQRLLVTLAHEARRRGAGSLTLEVRVSNEAAKAMYRKFGFAPVGVRRGYYVETGEDAIVMWAHDIDTTEYLERLDALNEEAEESRRIAPSPGFLDALPGAETEDRSKNENEAERPPCPDGPP